MASSPAGLPLCHSETPAWTKPPPWMSCSRHIPRPPASAGEVTDRPAAARRRSTDTCRSPTWMDPPRPLFCRIAAGVSERERRDLNDHHGVMDKTLHFDWKPCLHYATHLTLCNQNRKIHWTPQSVSCKTKRVPLMEEGGKKRRRGAIKAEMWTDRNSLDGQSAVLLKSVSSNRVSPLHPTTWLVQRGCVQQKEPNWISSGYTFFG